MPKRERKEESEDEDEKGEDEDEWWRPNLSRCLGDEWVDSRGFAGSRLGKKRDHAFYVRPPTRSSIPPSELEHDVMSSYSMILQHPANGRHKLETRFPTTNLLFGPRLQTLKWNGKRRSGAVL